MPEMPEVESVRTGLESLVQGKTIETVLIDWPRIIETQEPLDQWVATLRGQTIAALRRRGKYLLFQLSSSILISHLRMEGKYYYFPTGTAPEIKDKHTHVRFIFTDGSELHYHDVRKFGRMALIQSEMLEEYFAERKLGPEPIRETFKFKPFFEQLQKSNKAIKPLLLEQRLVSGLGNIYADEVLFEAQINPQRIAKSLTKTEAKRLHSAILDVMERAVQAGGSSVRTYLNALGEAGTFQTQLKVYGRAQEPCVRCGGVISKIQFAGRGTHFCKKCQREK